ncbi:MAG: PAS domain-containing protein [Alphaproteobacteria bacterium]|nr:PAS domain-containing protein [Alphaproteobacteria bacterium]
MVVDRDLTILWMNDAYLEVTGRERADILSRRMFDAFPSDPDSESYRQLRSSFDRVLESGETDEIAHIRYDIEQADGTMEERYWSATHTPFKDANGRVTHILQHTVDISELHVLRGMREQMRVFERAQQVETRNRDLSEETRKLRNLLENTPGFTAVLLGPDLRFAMANAAYRRLTGNRPLVGLPVKQALPEVIDQGFVTILEEVYRTAEPYFGRQEQMFLQTQPGAQPEQVYLEFVYQPIMDGERQVTGVFIQGHDVTEEVEATQRQTLLIHELNHRVKNTLAIVQGLAQQSFGLDESNRAGRDAFAARLGALSAAHNLLTSCNWESAEVRSLIAGSLDAALGNAAERCELEGPDLVLRPQQAVALAMIVHELATNALKYGALSVPDGRVAVQWAASIEDETVSIALDWTESGGPPVDPPQAKGFGSRLIQSGLGGRKGSVAVDYERSGLHCHIKGEI